MFRRNDSDHGRTIAARWLMIAALTLICTSCAHKVVRGTDYLRTADVTSFDLGPGGPSVELKGTPVRGTADTVVQRQEDARSGNPIRIQMVELSLASKSPLTIGGQGPCQVAVTLDKSKNSTGTMTIKEDRGFFGGQKKGTFTSSIDVNFTATFTDASGAPCRPPLSDHANLTSQGFTVWQHDPPKGALLVNGQRGDQNANLHSGLQGDELDFFIVNVVDNPAPIPRTQERVREKHLRVDHSAGTAPACPGKKPDPRQPCDPPQNQSTRSGG